MRPKNIISLISLFSSLALIFFLINPLWSSIKILKAELTKKGDEISKVEELLVKVQQIRQDYQELEKEAQKILSALPDEEDIPHLLVQFDTLASNNGLLLESIKFGQISQGIEQSERISPIFSDLSVNVKASGSYDAFKGYLAALEKSVRSMDVCLIQFGISKTGEEASILASLGIFEFNLKVSVYYQ